MDQRPTAAQEQPASAPVRRGRKRGGLVLIVIFLLLVLVGGAVAYYVNPELFSRSAVSEGGVVATVDGVEITREEVDVRVERNRTVLEAQGFNLDDPVVRAEAEDQILEQMVNEILVLKDAAASGIAVTEEEIEGQYVVIRDRFDSDEAFQVELTANLFTEESLRDNIERELTIQKYIGLVADEESVTVTEEEIAAFYEELSAEGGDLPSLEDLRSQIETQIQNQKLSQAVSEVIDNLRAEADIVVLGGDEQTADE